MRRQRPLSIAALAAFVTVAFLVPLAGQESEYTPPQTPWGDPDLRGHYMPGQSQPLETPRLEPWGDVQYTEHNYTFSRFFRPDPDAPAQRRERNRTPMIIDPPDGRVPLQDWAATKRDEIMERQEELEFLDPRVKCLPAAVPRAHLPVGYNTYQILQVPGAVLILYEWNHHSRYIPLDGRPHLPAAIKLGMGDPRGRWEGNTLVVESTNFTDNTWPVGHGAPPEGAPGSSLNSGHGVFHSGDLRVVERFTPVDENTINYEATIEDPNVFTQPWTLRYEGLVRAPEDHILYEYACHEGNGRNLKLMTGTDFQ